jgi:acyl-CoA thioesterase 8
MPDTLKSQTQEEHRLISTSLEVEKIDTFLYRSLQSALYKPRKARGVFGGQVISQAVSSATRSVDERYQLHVSLLAYPLSFDCLLR